jgi:hypothetical protein
MPKRTSTDYMKSSIMRKLNLNTMIYVNWHIITGMYGRKKKLKLKLIMTEQRSMSLKNKNSKLNILKQD